MSNDAQSSGPLPAPLLDRLPQEIHRALAPLVTTGTRPVEFAVTSVRCVTAATASARGETYRIVVDISCAEPDRALGRFPPFVPQSPSGYFVPYLQGYLRSLLEREGITLPEHGSEVEVRAAGGAPPTVARSWPRLARVVRMSDALASGALARGSALQDTMAELELDYLLMSGRTISGPSLAVLRALKAHSDALAGRRVIDLFAGSQAHALAARRLGASAAVCVDHVLPVGEDGLVVDPGGGDPAVVRVCADALTLPLHLGPTDVVVCDPFYEDFAQLCGPLLHRLARAGTIVVNAGAHPAVVAEAGPGSAGAWKRTDHEAFGETAVVLQRLDSPPEVRSRSVAERDRTRR